MTGRWRIVGAVLTVVAAAALAGCSSPTTAGSAGIAAAVATGASVPGGAAPHTGVVDACTVLTPAEIEQVIGANSGPKGDDGHCSWVNTDDQHSVTVDIGGPGTAVAGQLPAPLPGATTAPGPDGIRYSSGNIADFLIGDRACQIQVVTSVSDHSDRPTAVRLIGLIRQRVPS